MLRECVLFCYHLTVEYLKVIIIQKGYMMFTVVFYRNRKGEEPVAEYIEKLALKNDKDSRIKINKIRDYIRLLSIKGLSAGEPYIKHLKGAIWELRPVRDRILFAAWTGDSFVLLHVFMKQTQKTPPKEIEKAELEYEDFIERCGIDG